MVEYPAPSTPAITSMRKAAAIHSRYWKTLALMVPQQVHDTAGDARTSEETADVRLILESFNEASIASALASSVVRRYLKKVVKPPGFMEDPSVIAAQHCQLKDIATSAISSWFHEQVCPHGYIDIDTSKSEEILALTKTGIILLWEELRNNGGKLTVSFERPRIARMIHAILGPEHQELVPVECILAALHGKCEVPVILTFKREGHDYRLLT
jgi:hypothetical protein